MNSHLRFRSINMRASVTTRRSFLTGSFGCLCCSPSYGASNESRVGCFLRSAEGGSVKAAPAYKNSTGVTEYDAAVRDCIDNLDKLIGKPNGAKLLFVDKRDAHYNPRADVLAFGRALLDELRGDDFKLKLNCIAAHEICHSYQVKDPYMDLEIDDRTVRASELMADRFAGLCLAMIISGGRNIEADVIQAKRDAVESAFKFFFSIGDPYINERRHHGTPEERMEAISMGHEMSFKTIRDLDPHGDISYDLLDGARPFGR